MEKILEELYTNLCMLVPSRTDIHERMRSDLFGHGEEVVAVSWDTQRKLVEWVEKFQAPIYDQKTREWKQTFPEPNIELFLGQYYTHLETVFNEVREAREKLSRGENLFVPDCVEGANGVPNSMKSGGAGSLLFK